VKLTYSQKKNLQEAAEKYNQNLSLAEDYLLQRGLTLKDGNRYLLGVVTDPLPGHELYKDRLVIPYITRTGIVDIRFRSIDNTEPKYLGLPGASTHLFNVSALFRANDWIAVCEGEIDTITLDTKVGFPTIGVPGANNWKKHYYKLLADFEKIFIFADGDQAGQDFARQLAKELGTVTIISMPEGEDVNSIYVARGADYFKSKVAS
jgi:DNA primase